MKEKKERLEGQKKKGVELLKQAADLLELAEVCFDDGLDKMLIRQDRTGIYKTMRLVK